MKKEKARTGRTEESLEGGRDKERQRGRQKERYKCREMSQWCITKQMNKPKFMCDEIIAQTTVLVEDATTDGCFVEDYITIIFARADCKCFL